MGQPVFQIYSGVVSISFWEKDEHGKMRLQKKKKWEYCEENIEEALRLYEVLVKAPHRADEVISRLLEQ